MENDFLSWLFKGGLTGCVAYLWHLMRQKDETQKESIEMIAHRVEEIDKSYHNMRLLIAQDYVSKADLRDGLSEIKQMLSRMENKLDGKADK
jgi:hypothetical protein